MPVPSARLRAVLVCLCSALDLVPPDHFAAADVEAIEAWWSMVVPDFASLGVVLRLQDGRRFHLQYERDHSTPEGQEELTLDELAPGQDLPDGEPAWQVDVADLNEAFRGTRSH